MYARSYNPLRSISFALALVMATACAFLALTAAHPIASAAESRPAPVHLDPNADQPTAIPVEAGARIVIAPFTATAPAETPEAIAEIRPSAPLVMLAAAVDGAPPSSPSPSSSAAPPGAAPAPSLSPNLAPTPADVAQGLRVADDALHGLAAQLGVPDMQQIPADYWQSPGGKALAWVFGGLAMAGSTAATVASVYGAAR